LSVVSGQPSAKKEVGNTETREKDIGRTEETETAKGEIAEKVNSDHKLNTTPAAESEEINPAAEPMSNKPESASFREISMETVSNYYHKSLFRNRQAMDYLAGRGLADPKLIARFKIGFADGSLADRISAEQLIRLLEAGIFREDMGGDKGKKRQEHLAECLTFPLMDDLGLTVSLYGRSIDDAAYLKHLYLKGKHKGIFNRKASRVYGEIILTESPIDALSLIAMGFENVQPVYGVKGFTREHLDQLKDDRVKTVVIAFDNDDAGKTGANALKERLSAEGFKVKVISCQFSILS